MSQFLDDLQAPPTERGLLAVTHLRRLAGDPGIVHRDQQSITAEACAYAHAVVRGAA